MKARNVPISIYETNITRDSVGGEIITLTPHYPLLWVHRIELSGREILEAKQIKYVDPRKYLSVWRGDIIEGNIIIDDNNFYRIVSVVRKDRFKMEVLASKQESNLFSDIS